MSHNANDGNVAPGMPSIRVEDTSQVADANAASGSQVVGIEVDRGVSSWSVAEYKTRYVDSLDARPFGAMFLDGAHSFMFDRRNVRRDTAVGA